jgi:outer membrane protein assembly factor BamE
MLLPSCRTLCRCLIVFASLALAGCGTATGVSEASGKIANAVKPYKIDIIQGNVVTREQMALLRPGMPRAQVRDVLGTPLLTSVFHDDRWDYVFTLKRSGLEPQSRKVTVFFKDDLVAKIDADDLPSELEFVATLKSNVKADKLPPLEASPENLKKFPAAAQPAVVPPTATTSPDRYPPLEPAGK